MDVVNITEDTAGVGLPSKLTVWQTLTLYNLVDQGMELCASQAAILWVNGDGENAHRWQEQAKAMVMARNATIMGTGAWDYESARVVLRQQLDALRRCAAGEPAKDPLVAAGEGVLVRAGVVPEAEG